MIVLCASYDVLTILCWLSCDLSFVFSLLASPFNIDISLSFEWLCYLFCLVLALVRSLC